MLVLVIWYERLKMLMQESSSRWQLGGGQLLQEEEREVPFVQFNGKRRNSRQVLDPDWTPCTLVLTIH